MKNVFSSRDSVSNISLNILVILALLMALGSGCEDGDEAMSFDLSRGESSGFNGIIGGSPTGYASWQGAIGLRVGYSICSGTLIDPEVVMSAGHCVYLGNTNAVANPGIVTIVGGSNMGITYSKAAEVIKHPDWNGDINETGNVDLSLIRLQNPITTVENYCVRELPAAKDGAKGVIVGYGNSTAGGSGAGTHRAGNTEIQAQTSRIMELGDPAGTCQGDSGGPFFTRQSGKGSWALTAVTSFGVTQNCSPTGGGYSVNVLTYRDWINSSMIALTGHGLQECAVVEDLDYIGDPCSNDPPADWECDPVTNSGCTSSQYCDYGDPLSGGEEGFFCYTNGTEEDGDYCNKNGPFCKGGLACWMNRCRRFCCGDDDCGGETCEQPDPYWVNVTGNNLGICPSSAGDVDTDVDGDVDTDVDGDVDTDVDGDVDTDVDTDIDGDADADSDGDVDSDSDSDVDSDSDGDMDSDADGDADTDSDMDSNGDPERDAGNHVWDNRPAGCGCTATGHNAAMKTILSVLLG